MDIQGLDSGVPGDYINTRNYNVPRKYGKPPIKCIVVAFGLLCILQAALNISLRLYSKRDERQECMDLIGELAKHHWLYFNQRFYYISPSKNTWADSRNSCLQKNADLVVINSIEEQEFITSRHGGSPSWFGLSIQGPQGNWQWVDGTNVTLSYWSPGEPNAAHHDEDCALILNHNWVDNPCYEAKPWICEKKIGAWISQREQQGWEVFGRSLYYVSSAKMTWEGSRDDCFQRNATLVIVNSKEEQEFIQSKKVGQCWIGLSDRETEGEWKWVDGSELTYSNWGENEPGKITTVEACAETPRGTLPSGWNNILCDKPNFWTCEKADGVPLLEADLFARNTNDVRSLSSVVLTSTLLCVVACLSS